MIFNKTSIVSAALLLAAPPATNAASTRNVSAKDNASASMMRRLAQLEEMVANLHEERRLQQGCAPTFNAALGQCVYNSNVRFEGNAAYLNPVTFVNDVTIFGPDNDSTEFRVEGNVDTIFAQERTFLVGTETLFAADVFVGDDTDRPSRPSSRSEPSLFIDGNLAVLGESYFKDVVTIDKDAELVVEGDLKVEDDVEIEGDLDLEGDLNQ